VSSVPTRFCERRGVKFLPATRPGASVIFFLTGSPDRVSALSGRTTRVRIRPVIRHDRLEETAILSRFPVAFPLPAFASRPSDSRRGTGPSSRSAYRTSPPGPRRGLPRFARTSHERGGCLLCPEDGGAHPGWAGFPAGACRFAAASPCAPLQHPIGGADRNETSARGLRTCLRRGFEVGFSNPALCRLGDATRRI
jgi:hypothetical protein